MRKSVKKFVKNEFKGLKLSEIFSPQKNKNHFKHRNL